MGFTKRRLRDHSLPPFLRRLLSSFDNFEHLLLANALHLRQRNAELGSLQKFVNPIVLTLKPSEIAPSHSSYS